MPAEKTLSQSLLVENVLKSKQKNQECSKNASSSCCGRCITGRICGNTRTKLLTFWVVLDLGIVGLNAPDLWKNYSSYAYVVWPIYGLFVFLFLWSWERTGVSSSVKDNPPPANIKNRDLKKRCICSKCQLWKPERCHHCKICGVCVLKMDVHCPSIGICIGIKNYKAFCLFTMYLWLSQIVLAVVILPSTPFLGESWAINTWIPGLCYASAGMFYLTCCVFFLLMAFCIRHITQICSGKTTVETILDLPVFIEDQTVGQRFREIFGSSYWRWPFPLTESEPDGYSFKPLIEQCLSTSDSELHSLPANNDAYFGG